MSNPTYDAIDRFNALVQTKVQAGMDRRQAVRAVVRENPTLHRDYLIACNANRPAAQRLIKEAYSTPRASKRR